MGKSTTLAYLAEKDKSKDTSLWVIKIDLVKYKRQLEEINFNGAGQSRISEVVDFISKFENNNLNSFELGKKLLQHRIQNQGKLVLLLDGFDEVAGGKSSDEVLSNHQRNVIELMTILKSQGSKVDKMWISTRPHMKNKLEDGLSVFSYTLKPFIKEEQEEFLMRFWQNVLKDHKLKIVDEEKHFKERFDVFTEKLLSKLSHSLNNQERELIGIPLHTRILAEAFQKKFKEFYFDLQKQIEKLLPESINLLDLYKYFVEQKYEDYLLKKTQKDGVSSFNLTQKQWVTEILTKKHRALAFRYLLHHFQGKEEDFLRKKEISDKEMEELRLVGIIQSFTDRNEYSFIHRTFAEYFTADLLVNILHKEENNPSRYKHALEFLHRQFFKDDNKIIRRFFDCILADGLPIHTATLSNSKGRLLPKLKAENINSLDPQRRTALHLAAEYGYFDIAQVLLEHKAEVGINDKIFKWSPLVYAVQSASWKIAESLLKARAVSSDIKKVFNVRSADRRGITLLHFVSYISDIDVIHFLVKKGADVNAVDEDGRTPLHVAAEQGKLEIVKYLVENGADFSVADKDGNTPLHVAAKQGTLEIAIYLVEKGADFSVADKDGNTPVHVAAKQGNLEIVKYLVKKGADFIVADKDGNTPLNVAAKQGKLEIVKYLVEKGADFSVADKDGNTPLHVAAEQGKLEIVKYLIEKGAEVFTRSNHNTVLHNCIKQLHNREAKDFLERYVNS
jgi:ankyrin repeat protein